MSSAGLCYNTADRQAAGELWRSVGRALSQALHDDSPKSTQSLYLLIAAVVGRNRQALCRGAIHDRASAWTKMEALKPNVLSIFEKPVDGHAGGAGRGRHRRHVLFEERLPLHGQGRADRHVLSARGHLRRHQLSDPGQGCARTANSASPSSTTCSIRACSRGLPRRLSTAPTISGLEFKPDVAKYLAYPEDEDGRDGNLQPGLELHQSDPRRGCWKVQSGLRR